jgi:hypothetical protein
VESGDGDFGQGGLHNIVTIHEGLDDGADIMLRADLGTSMHTAGDGYGLAALSGTEHAGTEIDAGYEAKTGFAGGASRTVATYKSHPELVGSGLAPGQATGYEVFEMTSASRMSLGERVEVETGGRVEAVHAGLSAVSTHPFFRVKAHPTGRWTLEYGLASDRGLQEFGDVSSGDESIPVALVRNGRLSLESGLHQQFAAAHRTERATVQVAFYHDSLGQTAVAGGIAPPQVATPAGPLLPAGAPDGVLLDPTTGSFRALAAGYTTGGARFTVSSALTPALWVAAEYSSGEALETAPAHWGVPPATFQQALSALRSHQSETATVAVKGTFLAAGTRVRASYRWQPTRGVTAVDPYSAFGDQAYLSCLVRQPIRLGEMLPQGLEATIDVTNLLAQGYRPFVSADGQTLYFAQAPRSVQAGLSFSF